MAPFPEGAPCWADAMVPDLDSAKHFYSELLGWTFTEGQAEYGWYSQAFSGGKNVAALAPVPPGVDMPTGWNVYFASDDVEATAAKITKNGGRVLMGPAQVGEFGSMVMAQDPGDAIFGVWQAGSHKGFEKRGEPGSFAWVEICVRQTEGVDAFYPAVFPINVRPMEGGDVDYNVWEVGGDPVAGRYKFGADVPEQVPPHAQVYFAVNDCDDAVNTVRNLGGQLHWGPADSPYGRFAIVADQQALRFALIDPSTTVGEAPT